MASRGKGHKGSAHRKPSQGTANQTRPITNSPSKGIAPSAKITTAPGSAAAPATASSAPRKTATAVLEVPQAPSAAGATKPSATKPGVTGVNGSNTAKASAANGGAGSIAARRTAAKQPGYRSRMNQRKHMRQQQMRILGTAAAVVVVAGLAWLLISHLPGRAAGAVNSKAAKPAATAHVTPNATSGATTVVPTATQVVCATQKIPGLNGTPTTNSGPPAISGTLVTGDQCLQYVDVKPGSGPAIKAGDNVTVNYTGWLSTGQKFDSSLNPGRTPFQVQNVGQASVIEGWNLGLIGMKAGGERRLIIPYQVGYGAGGQPPSIPGYATLIFDITVISVN